MSDRSAQEMLELAFAAHATAVASLEQALGGLDAGVVLLPADRVHDLIVALRRSDHVENIRLATELQVQLRDSE